MTLEELLINLEGLSDEEAADLGWREYRAVYLNKGSVGVLPLYKGGEVYFHGEDRYDHAFRTSPDRIRNRFSKTEVARDRIERLRWIKAVIQGEVPNTQCWAVTPQSGLAGRDRLFIVLANKYVVRLVPRMDGGLKFATAYTATSQNIKRYTQGGTLMWTVPAKEPSPEKEPVPEKENAP
jgi:hypothetical protein